MNAIGLLLLSFICLIFASFGCYALNSNITNPFGDSSIELDGAREIKAIEILLIKQESSWSYPYNYYPVIDRGENISGTFKGPDILAGSAVNIIISEFNASEFLKAPKLNASEDGVSASASLTVNSTGYCEFGLRELPCGMYALYVVNANTSTILSALPVLITDGKMKMATQSNISAGDNLEVNVSMPSETEENLTYAAIVVSRKDYESAKLIVDSSKNKSSGPNSSSIEPSGTSMMVSVGNSTADIPSGLHSDSIGDLLTIMPENSAASLSESAGSNAKFYLMTDPGWSEGEYILTCVAYIHDKGIVGLEQKTIEVRR